MSWDAYTTTEHRTTGSATNGGGFSGNLGTPQLSLSDLVCAKGATTVTSVTGGFTAGMVGAVLVCTGAGGGFERGQYLITGSPDTNTLTVAHSPCPNAAGSAGVGTVSAGTDYSQQDAAQASGTNGTLTHGTTTFVDATANLFTAAMVGNLIRIQGTNFTTNWYQILTFVSASTVTLDRDPTPSLDGSAGVWAVGGALFDVSATLDTFLENSVAGVKHWLKAGTYTLTGAVSIASTVDGTTALPIVIEGYNTTRGDRPTGTNRPLIAAGSQTTSFVANYWRSHYLRITTTSTAGWNISGAGCWLAGSSCLNTSGTAGRPACGSNSAAGDSFVITNCEVQSQLGSAVSMAASADNWRIIECWIHDSANGIALGASCLGWLVTGNLIEQCGVGVGDIQAAVPFTLLNNTIVHCGTGVLASGAAAVGVIINNLIAYNKVGANWSGGTEYLSNIWRNNTWYGNLTDVTNVHLGVNDNAYDPGFTLKTWSDLACADHSGPPFDVTSAAAGFTSYFQAGDWFYISSNTGHWVAGAYRVTAVAAGTISLATDPTDGTDATSGAAQTLRTAVGVSDCRLGTSSSCRTGGEQLTLGVGS